MLSIFLLEFHEYLNRHQKELHKPDLCVFFPLFFFVGSHPLRFNFQDDLAFKSEEWSDLDILGANKTLTLDAFAVEGMLIIQRFIYLLLLIYLYIKYISLYFNKGSDELWMRFRITKWFEINTSVYEIMRIITGQINVSSMD